MWEAYRTDDHWINRTPRPLMDAWWGACGIVGLLESVFGSAAAVLDNPSEMWPHRRNGLWVPGMVADLDAVFGESLPHYGRVADEFAAAATGLARWRTKNRRTVCASSVHGLLYHLAEEMCEAVESELIRREIFETLKRGLGESSQLSESGIATLKELDELLDGVDEPERKLTEDTFREVADFSRVAAEIADGYSPPQGLHSEMIFAQLEQETCLANQRRRIARQSSSDEEGCYTKDENRRRLVMLSELGSRRRTAGRDHVFLEWNTKEDLGPAAIRDRWDGMSDAERREICPNRPEKVGEAGKDEGRDLVKKALSRAQNDFEKKPA